MNRNTVVIIQQQYCLSVTRNACIKSSLSSNVHQNNSSSDLWSFPQDIYGVTEPGRCGDGNRAFFLVFDTQLKCPLLSFCSRACGGLQLPAYFWGVLIASSLPPGKSPTPALPPLFPSALPSSHSSASSFAPTALAHSVLLSGSPFQAPPQGSRFE